MEEHEIMTDIKQLKLTANRNRKRIVEMVYQAGVGHVGGALSVIDLLTAIYELEVDFNEEKRTRVVLSKGHATPRPSTRSWHRRGSSTRRISPRSGRSTPGFRAIPTPVTFPRWTPPQAFWARDFPPPWVWLWSRSGSRIPTGYTPLRGTGRPRKARFGRP